jgi:hypothetical protein
MDNLKNRKKAVRLRQGDLSTRTRDSELAPVPRLGITPREIRSLRLSPPPLASQARR